MFIITQETGRGNLVLALVSVILGNFAARWLFLSMLIFRKGFIMYTGILLHILNKMMFVIGSYTMHFFLGRYLSEEQYGVIGTIITIINFEYIFFTDGVRQGMSKSISALRYDEKHLIRIGVFVQLVMIAAFFAGTYLGAPFIASILGDALLAPYIRGVALLLPFTGIYSLMLGILNGHKAFASEAGISMIYPVLKLSVIPAVLFVFEDAVVGTEMGFLLAGVITMVLSVWQVLRKRSLFLESGERIRMAEYLKTTLNYLLLFCVSTVMMNLDTLILKSVSGSNELVGYYTGVATFAKVPYFLLTAFYTVALPVVTRNYAAGELVQACSEIGSLMTMILSLVLPVTIVLSAAGGQVLSLFYKPSYAAGRDALSFLSFAIAFLGMTLVFTMVLSAADRKRFIAGLSVGMLVLEVVLCPFLTRHFSLTGTAAATFAAAGLGMLISAFHTKKVFGLFWQKKHTLLLLGNLAAYVVFTLLFRYVEIRNFFVLVGICGVCYAAAAGASIFYSRGK